MLLFFNVSRFHTNWYETSLTTQKLILNIMLRSSKPFLFSISGFYDGTLNSFLSVCYFLNNALLLFECNVVYGLLTLLVLKSIDIVFYDDIIDTLVGLYQRRSSV